MFGETRYDASVVGSGGKRGAAKTRWEEREEMAVFLVVETARSDVLAVVKGWVIWLRDIGWCSA